MIIGPANTTLVSGDANGYGVVADVSNLYVGITLWLNAGGQDPRNMVVTEVNRATKTVGLKDITQASGRTNISAYGGGTIDIPQQLWSNPNGKTYGDTTIDGQLTIDGETVAYDLIYPPQYPTADLPSAAASEGAIAYDTTANLLKFSDGSSWTGGSGSGVTTMAAIGSSPNANGATISGSNLNLQPASDTFGGVLTTGTQTIAGKKILSTALSSPTVAQTTTATVTIAVSSAGSDAYNIARDPISGGDYSATPYLTLQAAIDALPKVLKHSVFINIGAGSFAGAVISGFIGGGKDANGYPIGIYITGHTLNVTPATGVATGTAGAGTTTTSVVKPTAAANWTADDLQGSLFILTGGGGYISATQTVARPIKTNATTTATIDAISGLDNTSTFNIATPDTIINRIGASDLSSIRAVFNSCPIVLRLLKCNAGTGTLDYGVYSCNNSNLVVDACFFNEATTFNTVYSLKDGDVHLKNNIFLSGTNCKVEYASNYVQADNTWMDTSGPLTLSNVLNGKVTKLDSIDAPSYVLQAINMNSLQAEVDANDGLATPVYLECIGSFEAIGSNKLTGSGNTGVGCYGVQIEKAGRYTLIGSDITGDDGDVYFMSNAVTWSNLTSPSFGIVETYSGNAVGTGSYTKSITYGNKLFNGATDFSSRALFYGHLNQSSNLVVPTFVASETYDMNAQGVRGVLECVCNSASATVVLPDGCAISGVVVTVVNRGSATLNIEAPGVGTVTGASSDTIASGKSKTYVSLNGNSGQDFWLIAST